MKKFRKVLVIAIAAALLVLAFILVVKIIRGTLAILGGLLNGILGIVVILALVAIVLWMFSYARRH